MEVFLLGRSLGSAADAVESRRAVPDSVHYAWSDDANLESLANLAHELRTPVQVLLGYLDILREERLDPRTLLDAADASIIERMNVNVLELAQTVENVLEFAQHRNLAEMALEEEIELEEFLAELDPVLKAAQRDKNLTLRLDLDDAPRRFKTHRHPLRSIVVNLATNAIKFTEVGEVVICVRRSFEPPHPLVVEVRDTGAGISHDLLSSVFEPMVQLSHSSVRRHRGLGLGLAVVLHNVKQLGGTLHVESAPGVGSCFKVTIPCSSIAPAMRTVSHLRSTIAH
jgi:signal transduction histidine kinase